MGPPMFSPVEDRGLVDFPMSVFGSLQNSQAWDPGGCFTNVSRALQNILSKFVYYLNRISYENFKLKLCTCAQSHALGTRTKFQFEILSINVISDIVYFREIILGCSRNVSETTPWAFGHKCEWGGQMQFFFSVQMYFCWFTQSLQVQPVPACPSLGRRSAGFLHGQPWHPNKTSPPSGHRLSPRILQVRGAGS